MDRGDFPRNNFKYGRRPEPKPTVQAAKQPSSAPRVKFYKKRQFVSLGNNLAKLAVLCVLVLSCVYAFSYINGGKSPDKTIPRSNSFTGEKPDFSIYYPAKVPSGLNVDKGSIKSSKDIFSFNMNENGKQNFAVSEQPVDSKFKISEVKKKFSSSIDVETKIGHGVIGGIDNGTGSLITTIKTNDNTLIIVNCVSTVCSAPSLEILDSMKKINSLSDI